MVGSLPVKLLRPPNSNTDKSRSSRLSRNIFYFATGDTQKDSGLEVEFMLDTEASCSIINYRTFWEICQLQHPITIQKSTKVTKTYSGQTVPMIGYAIKTVSYDPDGQFIFPLTVWISEMRTQNLLGMDFCLHVTQILIIGTSYTSVLMLKLPVAGNIGLQTLIYVFQQDLLFNQIELLWLLACPF